MTKKYVHIIESLMGSAESKLEAIQDTHPELISVFRNRTLVHAKISTEDLTALTLAHPDFTPRNSGLKVHETTDLYFL